MNITLDSLKEKDIASHDDDNLTISLVPYSSGSSITYQQGSKTTVNKLQSSDYQLEIDTQYKTSIDTENPYISINYNITDLLTSSEQKEIINPNVDIIPGTRAPQEYKDYVITSFIEPIVVRRLEFDIPHLINTPDLNVNIIPGCDSSQISDLNHIQRYKNAFEAQHKDEEKVLLDYSTICYLTMDLQQTMPLPKLTTSKAFYLCQLWFYNFSVYTLSAKMVTKLEIFMFT